MDVSILKVVGQVAGLAGIALGVLLLIFRDVIRKQIFSTLTKDQSYRLLRLLLVLTWSIALAGIAAWVWASGRTGLATPTQTTLEFRDATTGDPVYRTPLDVEYIINGQRTIAKLPDNHRGKWTVEAAAHQVVIEAVNCQGYAFDPAEQGELTKGIIRLERSPTFPMAITPPDERIPYVSLNEYRAAVENQRVESDIQLTCKNDTRFYLNLVLKRWDPLNPANSQAATRTRLTVLAPCPRNEQREYKITDSQRGGYYYVFGSVCGLEGQLLWRGSLHGLNDPVLEVAMTEQVGRDPDLRAVLE